jgi:hypothetical protein
MEWLAILLLVYFVIGAFICLLVCVNSNDPGIMGKLNRFFLQYLPGFFGYIFIFKLEI